MPDELDLMDEEEQDAKDAAPDETEGAAGQPGTAGPVGIEQPSPFSDRPNAPASTILNAGVIRPPGLVNPNEGRANFQEIPKDAWWIAKGPAAPERDFHQEAIEQLRPILARTPASATNPAKVMEMATKLEGMLGFDADRKAGVPIMEALQKWGSKMYPNNPAALHAFAKPATMPFVPTTQTVDGKKLYHMSPERWSFGPADAADLTKASPVYDEKGQVIGHRSGGTFIALHPDATQAKAEAASKKVQLSNIDSEIKELQTSARQAINADDESQARIKAQVAALRAKRLQLYPSATNSPGPTKRLVWQDGKLVPKE